MTRHVTLLLVFLAAHAAAAQTSYYNLDSGRPTRVEDAVAAPRGELEAQLVPFRIEAVGDGTQRVRFEPKLAYGVLPRTEIEVRVPIVFARSPGTPATAGVASAGISALHAFNVETRWPALALAGEAVLPVGSLAASSASYSVKGLLTKTLPFARVQLNAGGGTWSLRAPSAAPVTNGSMLCGNAPGVPPCLIPDLPCDIVPASAAPTASFACMPSASANNSSAATTPPPTGAHWTAALGIDHTWPLISTLVIADVVVDRFDGLYPLDDWTGELGVRRQVTPQMVFDFGVSRRFAGTTTATSVTVGLTYDTPLRLPW